MSNTTDDDDDEIKPPKVTDSPERIWLEITKKISAIQNGK